MPVNKKIVLHPLERLDLVDVNALQDLLAKNVADAVAGVTGSVSGLLRKWASLSVNNTTDLITFADFTFQGLAPQTDTAQAGWSSYIGIFDASSDTNGTCSFDATKTLVQNYVTANNTLPPTPASDSYDEVLHTAFYPYIYARSTYGTSVQANRRFWSVADNQENTSLVNTRTVEGVQFYVGNPAPATGNQWAKIGRIVSWNRTGNVVSLSSSGVKAYMLSDAMFENADNLLDEVGYANLGGIAAGIEYLTLVLKRFNNLGQADDTSSLQYYTTNFDSTPYFSMGGLATEIMKLKAKKEIISTANIFLNFDNRPIRGDNRNFTLISKHLEATLASQLFRVEVDYTAISEMMQTPYSPAEGRMLYDNWEKIAVLNSHFVVLVDSSLLNRNFVVTITPITDRAGMIVIGNNGDPDPSPASAQTAYDGQANTFDILVDDIKEGTPVEAVEASVEFLNAFKIKPVTYTTKDGTPASGHGFRIRKNNFMYGFQGSGGQHVAKIATAFNLTLKILD